MIEWMEQNGYDVSYVSSADVDRTPAAQMLEPAQDIHDSRAFGILVERNAHRRHRRPGTREPTSRSSPATSCTGKSDGRRASTATRPTAR